MPVPQPDPPGRPSTAKHAAGSGPVKPGGSPDPGKGSTGSHRPGGEASLSDLIRGGSGSARRAHSAAELTAHLAAAPGSQPPNAPEDTDDAPTVITQNGKPVAPPPYVVGEAPSVAGRRLGHFELIEAIGSGGMAAVLKARDLELGRVVALKILPPEAALDPESVTRFKHEARAAAKLDHENVARVYFCGEDQGLHFIAFEFVEGVNLRALIDRRGPVPAGECVRYMLQVAAGLNHAAERGVVHRDIKPSNIIITPDGRAKIVDMGLARHLDAGSVNGGVTQSGVTLGTFDYISPEQALDPRRADVRSDIYSLGCAFYHALTGRPPVPEGTAAKKLYAHQHVDPVDPRELNPAVPDELAAVLARMMAKDPTRRYQTPAELIAHLKGVGERLRVSVDSAITDSAVRAVPADLRVLPEPPRLRLGWVLAACAVVAAAVAIATTSSDPGPAPGGPPRVAEAPARKDEPPPTPGPAPPRPGPDGGPRTDAEGFLVVDTTEELAEALAKSTAKIRLLSTPGGYDLTRVAEGVVFRGSHLELEGPAHQPARVRLAAAPADGAGRARPGGLTLRAASVAVRRVWFEVVTPPLADDEVSPGGEPVGLAVADAGQVEFTDCVVLPDDQARRAAVSVVVGRSAEDVPPRVRLGRCLFGPGRVGLRVPPGSEVTVDDSGFAPHAAAVQVEPYQPAQEAAAADPRAAVVRLGRSSFMVDAGGAAVEVDPGAGGPDAQVAAGYCVFAPAGVPPADPNVPGMPSAPRRGSVVRVVGEKADGVRFAGVPGRRNVYYRVDPVAVGPRGYTPDEARAADLVTAETAAADQVELRQRPWEAANGGVLAPLATPDPWPAFRLKLADPAVFADDPKVRLVGAQFHDEPRQTRRAYKDLGQWPPAPPVLAADVREKVWYPSPPAGHAPEPGEYADLVKLLRDAKNDDVILVRHDGPLPVDPTLIQPPKRDATDRGEFRLTFRPYQDSRPVLTLAPTRDLDASMFQVREGEVTFEGLQFRVRANPRDHRSAAAVTLVAARGCTFRECVFTLEGEEGKAAAVVLGDDRVMRLDPAVGRPVPRVVFRDCLIRGKGRGVWVPVSRPFELDVGNTVCAVEGPAVLVEAAGREPGAARSTVTLRQTTVLLGGPAVELHAGKVGEMRASGLVPVDVEAERCLFAAVPGSPKPVVEVDGVGPDEVKSVLTWRVRGERPNWYANFDPSPQVAVFRAGDDPGGPKGWGWDDWIAFAGEPGGRPVGKVTFEAGPSGPRDLAGLKPAGLKVTGMDFPDLADPKAGDAGADVTELPRPAEDEPKPD